MRLERQVPDGDDVPLVVVRQLLRRGRGAPKRALYDRLNAVAPVRRLIKVLRSVATRTM